MKGQYIDAANTDVCWVGAKQASLTPTLVSETCPTPQRSVGVCGIDFKWEVVVSSPRKVEKLSREFTSHTSTSSILGCLSADITILADFAEWTIANPEKGTYNFDITLFKKVLGAYFQQERFILVKEVS